MRTQKLKDKLFGRSHEVDVPVVEANRVFKSKEKSVKRILYYPESNVLFTFHDSRVIRVWDMQTGESMKSFDADHSKLVEIKNDILFIASSKGDFNLKAWDIRNEKFLGSMDGHSNWITRFIVENNFCLTASADGCMKLWDLETLQEQKVSCIETYNGHTKPVTALEIWRDLIFSGSADNTIRIWDLRIRGSAEGPTFHCDILNGHKDLVFGLKYHNDLLYSASLDQTIRVWDIKTGKAIAVHDLSSTVTDFRVDFRVVFEDNVFLTSSTDYTINAWNMRSGKLVRTYSGHTNEIRALHITLSKQILYSGAADRSIRKWDTGNCLLVFRGHFEDVTSLFMLKGWLYSASEDGTIREWNTQEDLETVQPSAITVKKTKHLDLSFSKITTLPNYTSKLCNLDTLYLNNNSLMQLPNDIMQLTRLKALNLDFNMFRQFPTNVSALKTLVQLYIEHNELSHLPSTAIADLKNLQMLYLGHNQLKELPPNIGELLQLQRLYAGNNQLTNLPSLGTLINLEVLKVEYNRISELPNDLYLLSKLRVLSISNNALTLPSDILNNIPAIFSHLKKTAEKENKKSIHWMSFKPSSQARLTGPQRTVADIRRRPPTSKNPAVKAVFDHPPPPKKSLPPIPADKVKNFTLSENQEQKEYERQNSNENKEEMVSAPKPPPPPPKKKPLPPKPQNFLSKSETDLQRRATDPTPVNSSAETSKWSPVTDPTPVSSSSEAPKWSPATVPMHSVPPPPQKNVPPKPPKPPMNKFNAQPISRGSSAENVENAIKEDSVIKMEPEDESSIIVLEEIAVSPIPQQTQIKKSASAPIKPLPSLPPGSPARSAPNTLRDRSQTAQTIVRRIDDVNRVNRPSTLREEVAVVEQQQISIPIYYHTTSDWFSVSISSRQLIDTQLEVHKKLGKSQVSFFRCINESYIELESQASFEEFLKSKEPLYVFDLDK